MESTINDILTRRSVKKYKSTPVPQELTDKIINAGLYAPSGMGAQSPIIIQVTNKEMRNKLAKMNADIMGADTDPFYGAPCLLWKTLCLLPTHLGLEAAGFTVPRRNLKARRAKKSSNRLELRANTSASDIALQDLQTASRNRKPKENPAECIKQTDNKQE